MMSKLDWSYREQTKRDQIIQKLKNDSLPVVIYGTGKFGIAVAEMLMNNDIEILCFLDKDEYWYEGKTKVVYDKTISCVNRLELSVRKEKFNLLLGMIDYSLLEPLKKEYKKCNIIEYLDAFEAHIMNDTFLSDNKEKLECLYHQLQDQESKDVMEAYLYARLTGDVSVLSKLCHNEKYLYDWELLEISKEDIFIDGGAYIGDSILEIKDFIGTLPKDVFAFEPDEKNLIKLLCNFSVDDLIHIHAVPAGLFEKDGEMHFLESGTLGSKISDEGDVSIKVVGIDDHEILKNVSAIKLDIEGSELAALKGAYNLIKANKPKLAICIYHKNEDIIEIYDYLKQFGYRFYLRQHAYSCEETVLYAI